MPVVWDLCSGLGGWTEAFAQSDDWEVVRIDNADVVSHVPHTHQLDVMEWLDWIDRFPRPDLVVASPPCRDFSFAYNSPKSRARREGRPYAPDMSLVEACRDIIEHTQPQWWVLENVVGSIEDISHELGLPTQLHGPFVMWGTLPYLVNLNLDHTKAAQDVHSANPLRANLKAMIPFEISFAVLKLWREQRTLLEWS